MILVQELGLWSMCTKTWSLCTVQAITGYMIFGYETFPVLYCVQDLSVQENGSYFVYEFYLYYYCVSERGMVKILSFWFYCLQCFKHAFLTIDQHFESQSSPELCLRDKKLWALNLTYNFTTDTQILVDCCKSNW